MRKLPMRQVASQSLLAAALGLSLTLVAGSAFAQKTPPPPKDGVAECSPGYWKNHTEEWFGVCCTTGGECEGILADLNASGPGSALVRENAAEFLDACFGTAALTPCEDD